jgi:hypothetical protein
MRTPHRCGAYQIAEGKTCPLAALGKNRDGKNGKLQINYGFLTDRRGCPVAVSAQGQTILYDPGEFDTDKFQAAVSTWPSPRSEQLGTPETPAIRFTRRTYFGATVVHTFGTACQFARRPVRT